MSELPVLKVYGAVSLTFTVRGRAEGMLIDTHSGLSALQIPDNMEVGVRRAGDSVDVVTRPRVPPSSCLIAAAPDMLAALQEVAELQGSAHAPAGSLWSRVNAAIAKATGLDDLGSVISEPDTRQSEIARARALYDKCDKEP